MKQTLNGLVLLSILLNGVSCAYKFEVFDETKVPQRGGPLVPNSTLSAVAYAGNAGPEYFTTPHLRIPNFAHPKFAEGRTIYETTSNGTWSALLSPLLFSPEDVVLIKHHVVFDVASADLYTLYLLPGAHLEFLPNHSVTLKLVNLVVDEGAHLEIGNALNPIEQQVVITVFIKDVPYNHQIDPEEFGHGLISFGKVTLHGSPKTSGAVGTRLMAEPKIGDTSLLLESPPNGWKAGDKLYLPDTKMVEQSAILNSFPYLRETVTIQNIQGNTLQLATPVTQGSHQGAPDADGTLRFLPHVAHGARNIIIRSENARGVRGYALFTHRAEIDIRYVSFLALGRTKVTGIDSSLLDVSGNIIHQGTNQDGRHPVYFNHVYGPKLVPSSGHSFTFIGNAVLCPLSTHQIKWGLVFKDSHYGLIQNNLSFNWLGAGFVTEAGNESQNVFEGNLAFSFPGPPVPDNFLQDFGDPEGNHGSGFWFRASNNYIRNNVAANARRYGFVIESKDLKQKGNIPKFPGADTTISSDSLFVTLENLDPLEFDGNEAYAAFLPFSMYAAAGSKVVLKNVKAWSPARAGLFVYYNLSRLIVDGAVIRGNHTLHKTTDVVGITHDVYSPISIFNADIQGLREGVRFNGWQSSRLENAVLKNQINAVLNYGDPTNHIKTRSVFKNVIFDQLPGNPLVNFEMNISFQPPDVFLPNEWIVEDYNGTPGANFQLFHDEQNASFVLPMNLLSCAGMTNQACWNSQSMAISGNVSPVNAIQTPEIIGGVWQ